ncbi:phage adaptor protein [Gorillibacterium sp. sgz5001074]|uniref:phage adaptor protein n=1 Tax=Gorillibacterium sp. sgz5001074 TaxID=3446695 RepID=UPI003F661C97
MAGLTIREIFAEADERVPNGLSVASKLRKLNSRERELYRTVFKNKAATTMDIMAGQFLYPLTFSKSKIISVVVAGRRYNYEDINDDTVAPPYLYTMGNALGLYPTPENDVAGGILMFHYEEPKIYTEADLDSSPGFDADFHMLHVFGLAKDLSEIAKKTDWANGYIGQYNALLLDYRRANPEPELPPMRVE